MQPRPVVFDINEGVVNVRQFFNGNVIRVHQSPEATDVGQHNRLGDWLEAKNQRRCNGQNGEQLARSVHGAADL